MEDIQSLQKLYLLGTPRLERVGLTVPISRRKSLALLAYLAVTAQPQARDSLLAFLWPEYNDVDARKNLRRDLSTLRRIVGKEFLPGDSKQLNFTPDAGLWIDVLAFRRLLAAAAAHRHDTESLCPECIEWLIEAVALYSADFMAGFGLNDAPAFDDWQYYQASALRHELASALQKLLAALKATGRFNDALPHARRWLAQDPLHEPAQRELMQLLAWSGQPAEALTQFEASRALLQVELGVEPEAATLDLIKMIRERLLVLPEPDRQRQLADHASATQRETFSHPENGLARRRIYSVPGISSSGNFIGRSTELEEIGRLLKDEQRCRILTLLGPGGIGKTQLAIKAVESIADTFADGVYFIPLAPLADASFLLSAIIDGLELTFAGEVDRRTHLQRILHDKSLLIILDNFEHLLAGEVEETNFPISLLSEIVQSAPGVKLLVTSRERLQLSEEWGMELLGMPFPSVEGESDKVTVKTIDNYPAILLFNQSALRAKSDFKVTNDNLPAIVRICQLVEGMPLGLELAAAWVRLLTCREIVDEIENNLDFLKTVQRDKPERHQSLRAVFEYSWSLLQTEEKYLLSQLSVFRGGFERRAAEQICGCTLLALSSLVDKSLLQRRSDGRFDVHERLRQFAEEKLGAQSALRSDVQDKHSRYYLAWLYQIEPELQSGKQIVLLPQIHIENGNVRRAWRHAIQQGFWQEICLAWFSLSFYYLVGRYQDGAQQFALAISGLEDTVPSAEQLTTWHTLAHGGSLITCAGCLFMLGDSKRSFQEFEEAGKVLGRLFEESNLNEQQLYVLCQLQVQNYQVQASLRAILANYAQGYELLEEGAVWLARLNSEYWSGVFYAVKGFVSEYAGDLDQAEQALKQGIAHFRNANDSGYYNSQAVTSLGRIALFRGAYAKSEALLQESLAIRQALREWSGLAYSFTGLGEIAEAQGNLIAAEHYHSQGLEVARKTGSPFATSFLLAACGRVAAAQEKWQEAIDLSNEAIAIGTEIKDVIALVLAANNLGTVSLKNNDLQTAAKQFQNALSLTFTLPISSIAADALLGLAEHSFLTGNKQLAIDTFSAIAQFNGFAHAARTRAQDQLNSLTKRGTVTRKSTQMITLKEMAAPFLI